MLTPLTVTVTLTTEADTASVWRALASPARWPDVLPDVASSRIEPEGDLAAGSTIRTEPRSGSNMIAMDYRALTVEPPRRLVLTSSAAGFFAETEYVIADDGEGGAEVAVTARVIAEKTSTRLMTAIWRRRYDVQIAASLRRRTGALLMLAETMVRESAGR